MQATPLMHAPTQDAFRRADHDVVPAERRKHTRFPIALGCKMLLEGGHELDGMTIDVGVGGLQITGSIKPRIGADIVVHISHFGRMEGQVVRHTPAGFAVAMDMSDRKKERVKALLLWLSDQADRGVVPEDRCHDRLEPARQQTSVEDDEGQRHPAAILNMSRSGAAIRVDATMPISTRITIGATSARVVRHFDGGIAVEFCRLIPINMFGADYVL